MFPFLFDSGSHTYTKGMSYALRTSDYSIFFSVIYLWFILSLSLSLSLSSFLYFFDETALETILRFVSTKQNHELRNNGFVVNNNFSL